MHAASSSLHSLHASSFQEGLSKETLNICLMIHQMLFCIPISLALGQGGHSPPLRRMETDCSVQGADAKACRVTRPTRQPWRGLAPICSVQGRCWDHRRLQPHHTGSLSLKWDSARCCFFLYRDLFICNSSHQI